MKRALTANICILPNIGFIFWNFMYSFVALFQSVFIVGTTSPLEFRRTEHIPASPQATTMDPKIT